MSWNKRLDRLEAALHQSPSRPTFTVWRREGDEMENVQTGERQPVDIWEQWADAFTLELSVMPDRKAGHDEP